MRWESLGLLLIGQPSLGPVLCLLTVRQPGLFTSICPTPGRLNTLTHTHTGAQTKCCQLHFLGVKRDRSVCGVEWSNL